MSTLLAFDALATARSLVLDPPLTDAESLYSPGSPSLTVTGPLLDGEGSVASLTLNLADVWECFEL